MGIPKKKTCCKCGETKFKREFYKLKDLKNFPDGYDRECKECRRREKREAYVRKPKGVFLINGRAMERDGYTCRIYWSDETVRKFRRLYPTTLNDDLAVEFGCSVRTIVRRAREMGLEKDSVWLHGVWDETRKLCYHNPDQDLTAFLEAGKKYRFKKGVGCQMSREQHSEQMKKAWEIRHRRMRAEKYRHKQQAEDG